MSKIVFFGDLVTDVVMHVERLPIEANRVQNVHSIGIEPGGAGNSLLTAVRLGAHAAALGTIGADGNGEQVYRILRDEGVDVSCVQRGEGSVNMSVIVMIDDAGQHVFLVHEGFGDELRLGEAERALIEGAAAFFVPGYALHEPRVGEMAIPALQIAVRAGVPVYCDLGPIVSDAVVRDKALAVLANSRACLLTEDEALTFTGAADADAAARWLQAHGARDVIIKRGPQGCSCYVGDGPRVDIAGLKVDARDTAGAGDSFAAGFLIDVLAQGDVIEAARFANAVGAAKVQKLGTGRNMPTREEVWRLVDWRME
ncbi:MAG: carbohydrate kinase family protein [Chloroflexi bacterium]|nr:carbohydrate kinase family protein [Chloroflexota bacterium]